MFVALVTMAFVATGPDEPVTSDVAAGDAADAAATGTTATAAPTPTPEPTPVPTAAADAAVEVAGADEGLAETAGSPAPVDPDAVVPEDFVPVFVSEDLTETGAHTSATPEPVATAPPAPAPAATTPPVAVTPAPPASTPSQPAPTPVPATPQAQDDENVPDRPPSGDAGGDDDASAGGAGGGGGPSPADWAALRNCESSGNYAINTGNGYFGAYQFSQSTWDWVASMVRPDLVGVVPSDASPGDQDAMAFALYDINGASPWPTCGRYLR